MAYATGVSSNPSDLLTKINAFAVSIGWSVHRSENLSATSNALYLSHANAGYFVLVSDDRLNINTTSYKGSYITLYGATSFGVGGTYSTQPGSSPACVCNDLEGPHSAYHLFGTTQYIHVAVEVRTGIYTHFGFGRHNKAWNYTGGEYLYSTAWQYSYNANGTISSDDYVSQYDAYQHRYPFETNKGYGAVGSGYAEYIRCDIDGVSPYWFKTSDSGLSVGEFIGGGPRADQAMFGAAQLFKKSPSTLNAMCPLIPIQNAVMVTGPRYITVGDVPDLRYVKMLYTKPGEIVSIGGDQWVLYPVKRHALTQVPENEPFSYMYGLAFKKIV